MPRQEKPQVPPPRLPVAEYQTPVPSVVFFSELVNRHDIAYDNNAPIPRGTLYSTLQGADPKVIAAYPSLYFLRETRVGNTEDMVIWVWSTVPDAEDTYNAEVDYVSDYAAAPQFTRVYTVRRDTYDAAPTLTLGSPLSGIVSVTVDDGGADYRTGDTVQFNSSSGSGAEGELVLDSNGTIQSVIVTTEGSGYATAPTVQVISATGAGAILIANLQPQTAVLVAQKKTEFAEDNLLRNEFVKVTRVYETLPGPYICSSKVDEDGLPLTTCRRHNLQSAIDAITPRETLSGGTWDRISNEPVNESYFVGWEIHDTRDIPGNVMTETKLDEAGNAITVTRQMVATSSVVTSETVPSHVWTKKYGEPISDLVSWQIIETLTLPGKLETSSKLDEYGDPISITNRLQELSLTTTQETLVANVWKKVYVQKVSDLVVQEITETQSIPGNTETETKFDNDGNPITITKFLQAESAVVTSETIVGGVTWRKKFGEPVSELVSTQIQQDITIPGVIVSSSRFRSDGSTITVARRLKQTSSIVEGGITGGGFLILTRAEEVSDLVSYEVIETSSLPGPDVHGEHIDEKYGLVIDITKTVVADGTDPSPNPAADGTYYEIKPHDKWQSVQIASKFDTESLPEDTQWFAGMIYSFPPELTSAVIDGAFASCGCSFSFSADIIANMKQYHGPVKTRITEQFYNGVPPDDVTITQFFPEAHDFGFAWSSACGSTDGDCHTKSGAPHFHIPLCLHDDLTLTLFSATFNFAATNPAALPHGSYIMLTPHIERWRFGVYRRVLTEVYVP